MEEMADCTEGESKGRKVQALTLGAIPLRKAPAGHASTANTGRRSHAVVQRPWAATPMVARRHGQYSPMVAVDEQTAVEARPFPDPTAASGPGINSVSPCAECVRSQ